MACSSLIPYLKCRLLKMPLPHRVDTKKNSTGLLAESNKRKLSASSTSSSGSCGIHRKKCRRSSSNESTVNTSSSSDTFINDDLGHLVFNIADVLGDRYKILDTLGEGTFGRVLKVLDLQENANVAMKVVRNVKKYREAALMEIDVLDKLEILGEKSERMYVKMFNWFNYHGHICITFEILGLSVFDFMKLNHFRPYPVDDVRVIGYQLCQAVKFLHENFLTHTDLKPENILFINSEYEVVQDADFGEVLRLKRADIKLIDFGSATFDDEHHSSTISTRHYRSPEVILELGWSQPCDVWSIGCIFFEIATAITLFQTHDNIEHLAIMQKLLGNIPRNMTLKTADRYFINGKLYWDERTCAARHIKENCNRIRSYFYDNAGEDYKLFNLILKMLEYHPYKRITLCDAVKYPFFNRLPASERLEEVCKGYGDAPP